MTGMQLVVFRIDGQRFALPLPAVERVVAAVEVTPVPGAPATVLGAIDVAGSIVPVMDVRARFALQRRAVAPADQLLLAVTRTRTVALAVDEAEGVVDVPASAVRAVAELADAGEAWRGIVRIDDGLVLIHDLDRFLSHDETCRLDDALRNAAHRSDRS